MYRGGIVCDGSTVYTVVFGKSWKALLPLLPPSSPYFGFLFFLFFLFFPRYSIKSSINETFFLLFFFFFFFHLRKGRGEESYSSSVEERCLKDKEEKYFLFLLPPSAYGSVFAYPPCHIIFSSSSSFSPPSCGEVVYVVGGEGGPNSLSPDARRNFSWFSLSLEGKCVAVGKEEEEEEKGTLNPAVSDLPFHPRRKKPRTQQKRRRRSNFCFPALFFVLLLSGERRSVIRNSAAEITSGKSFLPQPRERGRGLNYLFLLLRCP